MRPLYAARQRALVAAIRRELAGRLEAAPTETGLHLMGWLPEGADDVQAAVQAAAHDVEVAPLAWYCLEPPRRAGLLLGFGGVTPGEIRAGCGGWGRR